jgi:hypothetical protein
VGFVVDKVALGQIFLQFIPVSFIPLMFHIHASIYDQPCIILAIGLNANKCLKMNQHH